MDENSWKQVWTTRLKYLDVFTRVTMRFSSSRAPHVVLCGGGRQWVVLPAVAGDPPQSQHFAAEQIPEAGGELWTDREGLQIENWMCLCCFIPSCHELVYSSLNQSRHHTCHCEIQRTWFHSNQLFFFFKGVDLFAEKTCRGKKPRTSCVIHGVIAVPPGK